MFLKIGVLKNFAIFTGKHLCWSRFLIKLQRASVFSYAILEISKNSHIYRTPPMAVSIMISWLTLTGTPVVSMRMEGVMNRMPVV